MNSERFINETGGYAAGFLSIACYVFYKLMIVVACVKWGHVKMFRHIASKTNACCSVIDI